MNTKHISLAFAAVAALLAGCAKSPVEKSYENGQLTDLELAYIGATETKAAIDGTTFPTDGEIGLFLFTDEATATPYGESGYTNVKYSYNSTKEKWTADPSIKVGSTPGYLYGYYPYSSTATDVKAIPVNSSLNGDDVMYATSQTVTDETASQTSLTMNHALARVSILIKNNGYTGEAKLSKIKLEGAEIAPSGTLNAIDGSITATKSSVTLDVPTANQAITASGTTYECLLVPSKDVSSKQEVTFTFSIDGVDMSATLTGDNGVIIAQGTKSNITIILSNSGISVQTVSVDDWKEVEVGGHKVTVLFGKDVIPHDIMMEAYADGDDVIIKAYSETCQHLKCTLPEGGLCPQSKTDKLIYTYTLSDIKSNLTAIIDYAKPVTVNVSSLIPGSGTARIEGECYEGETISFIATEKIGAFIEWQDADGNILSKNNPYDVILTADLTATAVFADYGPVIPGVFTVADDGKGNVKKVLFSKGNLWADESKALHFEETQLLFTPFVGTTNAKGHASYFTWSSTVSDAIGVSCSGDYLFCDEGHKVSVENSENIYYALSNAEWNYLLNRSGKCKAGVTVCDKPNCLIILPDDWKWEGAVGTGWQNSGYPETSTDQVVWKTMEDAGAVCLPATGSFYNNEVSSGITQIGDQAHYWSSTSNGTSKYYLYFDQTGFTQKHSAACWSYALRLVRDY